MRWSELLAQLKNQETTLCGDVMLISHFVSYVLYLTKKYLIDLMDKYCPPYLRELMVPVPLTNALDPLTLLTRHNDADIAAWSNQDLPSDRMSVENATILCNTGCSAPGYQMDREQICRQPQNNPFRTEGGRMVHQQDKPVFYRNLALTNEFHDDLAEMDEFRNLDTDIEGFASRWKKFVESEAKEKERFPQEWKKRSTIQKRSMRRCTRPDRKCYGIRFEETPVTIMSCLDPVVIFDPLQYVDGHSVAFAVSLTAIPMFFILSPGVDALAVIAALSLYRLQS
ncbi:dynein heavy chain 17, axonemal isoform X1 [Tachysurus ichikawai]